MIFTHDESALDAIESTVSEHSAVIDVFQDSGQWYSNGESGPEWFTMHVVCLKKDQEGVKQMINDVLKDKGYSDQVSFMQERVYK